MNIVGSSTVSSPQQGSYAQPVETPSVSAPEVVSHEAETSTPAPVKADTNDEKNSEKQGEASEEAIRKAVSSINKHANGTEAVFGIHDKTNRVTIKIVDKETKDVIREVPAEKTLDLIAKAWELAGLMVDEKR